MENVINEKICGWKNLEEGKKQKIFSFCDKYIDFLNEAKTEREAAKLIIGKLRNEGFVELTEKEHLVKGDKVYFNNRGKSVFAAIIGDDELTKGINIIGAHIDSPRLDLKPNPIYEDSHLALFKTHYYGGIKKYQWTAIPLAIHGVVVKPRSEERRVGKECGS